MYHGPRPTDKPYPLRTPRPAVTPKGIMPKGVAHDWRVLWCRTAWRTGLRHPGVFLRGISTGSGQWTYRVGTWLLRRFPSRRARLSPWEMGA